MNVYIKLLNRISYFSNKVEKTIQPSKELKLDLFLDRLEKEKEGKYQKQTQIINLKDVLEKVIEKNKKIEHQQRMELNDLGVIMKSSPSEIIRYSIDQNKDYTIKEDDPYFFTQLNPPDYNEFFKFGLNSFHLTLKDDFPETCYKGVAGIITPRLPNNIPCSTLDYDFIYMNHWGQRKLLFTEIDFLTMSMKNREEEIHIVYAGAAHGTHLPYLYKLFPNIIFHLYDPSKFDKNVLKAFKNKVLRGDINEFYKDDFSRKDYGFFTDEVAEYYKNKFYNPYKKESNLFFISDIRMDVVGVAKDSEEYTEKFEENVMMNNDQQQTWIRIMRPRMSMLKFKVPYVKVGRSLYYKHMNGQLRFQTWGPINSAETRLIVSNKDIDHDVYFNIMSYERKTSYYNYLRQANLNNKLLKIFPDIHLKTFCKTIAPTLPYYTIDFYNEIKMLYTYLIKFGEKDKITVELIQNIMNEITRLINYEGKFRLTKN
jgi:hypothetical protein